MAGKNIIVKDRASTRFTCYANGKILGTLIWYDYMSEAEWQGELDNFLAKYQVKKEEVVTWEEYLKLRSGQ